MRPAVEAPNLLLLLSAGAIVLIASLAKSTIFLKYMTSAPASAPVYARLSSNSGSLLVILTASPGETAKRATIATPTLKNESRINNTF